MKNKLYRCTYTGLVGQCVRTEDQGRVLYIRDQHGVVYSRTISEVKEMKKKDLDEHAETLMQQGARTWGRFEQLAGITDRNAFWKDKDEAQAKTALRELIRERVARGELS